MIRTLTLLATLTATAAVQAQFITLTHEGEVVPNGSVYTYDGPADATVFSVHFDATLNDGPDRTVNVKRYELSVQPGTANYFCWGICYAPVEAGAMPYWAAFNQHSLQMEAGVPLSNFAAYHEPWEQVGVSSYRYVMYDMVTPTDSIWVDIVFNSLATDVHELAAVRSFQVFPNPSLGEDISMVVDLSEAGSHTTLSVYNLLGERVQASRMTAGETRTVLPTQALAAGVYLATIEQQGRAIATRRFVVTR